MKNYDEMKMHEMNIFLHISLVSLSPTKSKQTFSFSPFLHVNYTLAE